MTRARIAILDYGMGNLRSVEKALEHVGCDVSLTNDHARVRAASGIVLPGVGAFPKAMEHVHALGLDELVRERAAAGVPTLGICLGMQLLFERSTELGGAEGIGVLRGVVDELDTRGLKLPQIGWNEVAWERPADPFIAGLPDPCAMYHVHTYTADPADPACVLGRATYGAPFTTAVSHANVFGVQFHPEKSSEHGLRMLGNFARIATPALSSAR